MVGNRIHFVSKLGMKKDYLIMYTSHWNYSCRNKSVSLNATFQSENNSSSFFQVPKPKTTLKRSNFEPRVVVTYFREFEVFKKGLFFQNVRPWTSCFVASMISLLSSLNIFFIWYVHIHTTLLKFLNNPCSMTDF